MGQGKRIWQLEEETSPLSTDYIVIDRSTYENAKKLTLADVISAASKCITDVGIIAIITAEASWTTQIYTGSTADLTEGDYYLDTTNWVKYEFICGTLIRFPVNSVL